MLETNSTHPIKEGNLIIGHDSLNQPIQIGDGLLIFDKKNNKTTFQFAVNHRGGDKILKIFDASKKELLPSAIDHILINRGCNHDIDELSNKDESYWKDLDRYIDDDIRLKSRPRAEDWYDRNYPSFQLQGRMTDSVHDGSPIGYFSRVKKNKDSYEFDILYPGQKTVRHQILKVGEITRIGSGISAVSITKEEKSEHAYLQVSNIFIDPELGEVKESVTPRLESQDDVISRLRADFPWLKNEDIYPLGPHIPLDDIRNSATPIDSLRLRKLYGGLIRSMKELNQFEEEYVASRNYLRLVEFSQSVEKNSGLGDTTLALMTSQDKVKMVEKFLSKVQEEKDHLLKKRKEREYELFGFEIPVIVERSRRMVSQDTIAPRHYLGNYFEVLRQS